MSSEQSKSSGVIIFTALLIAIASVGASYATYVRLNDSINNNHIVTNRLQQLLQTSIKKNSDAIAYLSNKNTNSVAINEVESTDKASIINHINAQNKVISKMLEHYQSLQNQVSDLKRQDSNNDNFYANTPSALENHETPSQSNVLQEITEEVLEQELALEIKNEEKSTLKTESIFRNQTQEGIWAAETNVLIQNSLEKIRTEPEFNGIGINNIDCRESMCKVELSHKDSEQLENFDLMFLLEVSGDQTLTATTINKPLADGGVNSTYYLSTN